MNDENLVSILRGLSNDLVNSDSLVYKNALFHAAERIEQLEAKLEQKELELSIVYKQIDYSNDTSNITSR